MVLIIKAEMPVGKNHMISLVAMGIHQGIKRRLGLNLACVHGRKSACRW